MKSPPWTGRCCWSSFSPFVNCELRTPGAINRLKLEEVPLWNWECTGTLTCKQASMTACPSLQMSHLCRVWDRISFRRCPSVHIRRGRQPSHYEMEERGITEGEKELQQRTRIMVYNGQGEIGLVLAVKIFPKKTSPGHKFGGGH